MLHISQTPMFSHKVTDISQYETGHKYNYTSICYVSNPDYSVARWLGYRVEFEKDCPGLATIRIVRLTDLT